MSGEHKAAVRAPTRPILLAAPAMKIDFVVLGFCVGGVIGSS
ncbi:MAG: hypothetical protein SV966_16085 [Actinomycetota bacterium]|nr:hypothetical protein [Actinomycetota bacterium]